MRFAWAMGVVAIAVVGCGGGTKTVVISTPTPTTTAPTSVAGTGTTVVLSPVNGSAASGSFHLQTSGKPALQIHVTGLEPSMPGQTYIVWLYESDSAALPLARNNVGQDGSLSGIAPIPDAVVPFLNRFTKIVVARAENPATQRALDAAANGSHLPNFVGTSVAEGALPPQ